MAIYKLGEICTSVYETKKPVLPQLVVNTSNVFLNKIYPQLEKVKVLGQFKKIVKLNDIIFSEIRPGNGRWAYINHEINALFSTKFMVIRTLKNTKSKYLYFLLTCKLNNKIIKIANDRSGTFPQITFSEISPLLVNLPSLKEQQKIIDIIEPIENIENKLINIKNKLVKLLINLYNYSNNTHQIIFNSITKILSSKYENQTKYFATNAVGELEIDYQKIINLSEKIPSRANISPDKDSFIFSKLAGENKIFYFKEKPKEVFSTGFFNFKTEYHDHILGFMLSDEFKQQKEYLSTGTTMQGINNSSLALIKLNKPNLKSNIITSTLYDLENNLIKIKKLKIKLIELLIK